MPYLEYTLTDDEIELLDWIAEVADDRLQNDETYTARRLIDAIKKGTPPQGRLEEIKRRIESGEEDEEE